MFLLRTARQQPRFMAPASTRAPALVSISRRFASSDYGSGEHNDLKRSKSEQEHPGPAPPSTGDKGSSASKSGEKKSGDGSQPQPKILNASPPKEGEQSEDVKKHNEEMKQRAERPHEGQK